MQTENEVNEETGKSDYIVKATAKINISNEIYEKAIIEEDLIERLNAAIYEELIEKTSDIDSVGIWIEYDGETIDNAIKIQTLDDMKNFSIESITPIHEFFKLTMTLNKKDI